MDAIYYERVYINGYWYIPEHILVATRAFGKPLPPHAVVHHINEDISDNRPENLLICTRAYHQALHARMRQRAWIERMVGT